MSQGQQQQLTMGRTEWVMLLALSIVFGGAFFFFEIGVQTFAPLTLCGSGWRALLCCFGFMSFGRAETCPHRLGLGPLC